MAKIGRDAQSGEFVTQTALTKRPRTTVMETVTIRDKRSGKVLPLKGYGSLKGQFSVKPGMDISKPIAAQTALEPSSAKK